MKIPSVLMLVIIIFSVLITGCTSQQPVAPPVITMVTPTATIAPSPSSLPQNLAGNWVLTTMAVQGGTAVIMPTTEINLEFMPDGSLTGYDGCNNYFASYTITGTTTMYGSGIIFGPVSTSKKYCAALSEQSTTYYDILSKTTAYVVDDTQLTLTASTKNVLIYQPPSTLKTPAVGP
jgi:heat shock protein HslJ